MVCLLGKKESASSCNLYCLLSQTRILARDCRQTFRLDSVNRQCSTACHHVLTTTASWYAGFVTVRIWIEQTEGAKFWLRVMTEIKSRGVNDILIAIVDGLKGFPEAINADFAKTQIQTCIVHLIRNSLDFCSWKERKPVAAELKKVNRAADAQAAHAALQDFEDGPWGQKLAAITAMWRRNWAHIIPFFAYPPELRKMIYTTDEINKPFSHLATSRRRHAPRHVSVLHTSTHATNSRCWFRPPSQRRIEASPRSESRMSQAHHRRREPS